MATIADYRGIDGPPQNLVTEGSRASMAYCRATMTAADDTAGTFNVRFPQLSRILGFWVTVLGAGNNLVGHALLEATETGLDVTIGTTVATLNRLTIADGQSGYDLTLGDIAHILVVGIPR